VLTFAPAYESVYDLVAQLVEHLTFNQVALGSNPSGITINKDATTSFTVRCVFVFYGVSAGLLVLQSDMRTCALLVWQ
jgi:hypothetical protein